MTNELMPEEKGSGSRRNTILIGVVVGLLLLCCCGTVALWYTGDIFAEMLGLF
jgi:hypothetical protein